MIGADNGGITLFLDGTLEGKVVRTDGTAHPATLAIDAKDSLYGIIIDKPYHVRIMPEAWEILERTGRFQGWYRGKSVRILDTARMDHDARLSYGLTKSLLTYAGARRPHPSVSEDASRTPDIAQASAYLQDHASA